MEEELFINEKKIAQFFSIVFQAKAKSKTMMEMFYMVSRED